MIEFCRGDVRTAASGSRMFDQIVATGSLVLRTLGGTRAGEVSAHRFLSSPHVTTCGILETFSARTRAASVGRRVVVAQDTTEINFSGRGKARRGLGPAGDGKSPGFFIHPNVVVDADEEVVLGLAGAKIWTREEAKAGDRSKRALEAKESARWPQATKAAAEVLVGHAVQVIIASDREGDIWSHFVDVPQGVDLAIRSRHDRPLEDGKTLFEALAEKPPLAADLVRVAPRGPGEKARVAKIILRAGKVRIKRPKNAPRTDPKVLEIGFVEAIERNPPQGVKPLVWRILTTLPVETADDAKEVVRFYRLRWRIEEVFRALKSDGLALEDTQVQDSVRLFRLAAMGLGAAVRILQLVNARDGSSRPMNDVLDETLVEDVAILVRAREGATDKQKNPHPQGSLAWLSWVVARYGGWNCYGKPPGPKTMANGWIRFSSTLCGVILAKAEADP
jgi:hypothetical protein